MNHNKSMKAIKNQFKYLSLDTCRRAQQDLMWQITPLIKRNAIYKEKLSRKEDKLLLTLLATFKLVSDIVYPGA